MIATIRGERFHEYLKFKVLDIESGDIKEVTKDDLINAIKKNNNLFENVSINNTQNTLYINSTENYELITKEGMGEMPMVDLEGTIVSRNKYIILSLDEAENSIKLAKYDGTILDIELTDVHNLTREIAGVPEKYTRKTKKTKELTEEEKKITAEIDKQYESFILMTRTLGIDCSFKYTISGTKVALESYTGSSKHVIVPKFITLINSKVFHNKGLTGLSLNDGLETIGIRSFASNNIDEIDIPKTVKKIDKQAFYGNSQLFKRVLAGEKYKAELDENKFRTYSKDIDIRGQW